MESSQGYTANNSIKPDIAAPGVDIYGPVSRLRYGERSGTSVSAAHTAGVAAMLLEWAIIGQNDFRMNTITCKYYLIRGARKENMTVPNRSFGDNGNIVLSYQITVKLRYSTIFCYKKMLLK